MALPAGRTNEKDRKALYLHAEADRNFVNISFLERSSETNSQSLQVLLLLLW
jgi:hypothetical protein